MKKCHTTSLAIRKMQIKMALRFCLTPVKCLSSVTPTTNAGEGTGKKEHFYTISGNVN
jgi:hypothetical protein